MITIMLMRFANDIIRLMLHNSVTAIVYPLHFSLNLIDLIIRSSINKILSEERFESTSFVNLCYGSNCKKFMQIWNVTETSSLKSNQLFGLICMLTKRTVVWLSFMSVNGGDDLCLCGALSQLYAEKNVRIARMKMVCSQCVSDYEWSDWRIDWKICHTPNICEVSPLQRKKNKRRLKQWSFVFICI